MQGPDRVLRPISELIVCEGSSLTFYWLENPRPTTGRKALSLRERSTFGSGLVMSWLDEVDQVDFGIFLDIKLVEEYMRNYGRGEDKINSWDEANVAWKRKGAPYSRIQPSILSLHPCAAAPIRACHASC
jgi:hypothetical protein